jgi:hypothetical protein
MSIATALNFSDTTPSPPSGKQNIKWQNDGGAPTANESAYDQVMVGDTGSGGLAGNAPAPASGDAAAGKYLKADGTWAVPPGNLGTFTEELVTFSGTAGTLAHTPLSQLAIFRNGLRMNSLGGSPDYTRSGTSVTLTIAAGGSDVFVATYYR